MATYDKWDNEIMKMTKDELTVALSAYENLLDWAMFRQEFQLDYFKSIAYAMRFRVEQLAAMDS